jgi:hypothetical protein
VRRAAGLSGELVEQTSHHDAEGANDFLRVHPRDERLAERTNDGVRE